MRTYYIYRATNRITQESYIGQTNNFRNRKWQHERCYEKEKCKFHDAIEKYGTVVRKRGEHPTIFID